METPTEGYLKDEQVLRAYLRWLLRESLPHKANILDLGCADAYFLKICAERGFGVYGVDNSKHLLSEGKRNFGKANLCLGDVEHLSFESNTFELVTMFDVIEHLPSPYQGLTEVYRVLKVEGILVLTTPNLSSIGRRILKEDWHGYRDGTHLYLFTPESISFTVKQAGFRVSRLETPFHVSRLLPAGLMEPSFRTGYGGAIWLVASKES